MRRFVQSLDDGPEPFAAVNGTAGPDFLVGTEVQDRLQGFAGNDVLRGLGGTDRLDGGSGLDDLDGGFGNDTLDYGTDNRGWTINIQTGSSTNGFITEPTVGFENVIGSPFDDVIIGTSGSNLLQGGVGNDRLIGGGGGDNLQGGSGDDIITGGDGIDRYDGSTGIDTISFAGAPGFIVVDLVARLTYNGFVGESLTNFENIIGTSGNDSLYGDSLANVIDGGAGGSDVMNGFGGIDTVTYASNLSAVVIDFAAEQTFDAVNTDSIAGFERAIGSAFNDSIFASQYFDTRIDGGPGGNDRLVGNAGFDTLSYQSATRGVIINFNAGLTYDFVNGDTFEGFEAAIGSNFADQLIGALGNDNLDGGDGNDFLSGSIGNDVLRGSGGNDVLSGDAGSDTIDGGAGVDTASYASNISGVNVTLGGLVFDGSSNDTLTSIENLVGSAQDDNLRGDAGDNMIDGGTDGADMLDGSFGFDTVTYASAVRAINIDLLGQTGDDLALLDRIRNFEAAIGTSFDDRILGSNGADTIDGGAGGADVLDGRLGIDTVSYVNSSTGVYISLVEQLSFDGLAQDQVVGFESARGSAFADVLLGNSLGNFLAGGAGNDLFYGGLGADSFDGGAGSDSIFGGGEGDDFYTLRRGETQGDVLENFTGNGGLPGDVVRLLGFGMNSSLVLVDAATSTYRVTDAADNFTETFRIVGAFDFTADFFFG